MKSPIAALTLVCALAASSAGVQTQGQGQSPLFRAPRTSPTQSSGDAAGNATAPTDDRVIPAEKGVPDLTAPSESEAPPAPNLPNEPIEPYLLSKENGPFMVMAKTFRGVDAERMALALAKELRQECHLPAYILRTKDIRARA